jgi:thioredoxin 2
MSIANFDDKGLITACATCGKKNRIPYEHLGETGRCGNCQSAIPPPSTPLEMDSAARFERIVGASPVPVVVDYWAPWCGPCRMVAPELEKVATANRGKFLVVKVNTEALPAVGARYQVESLPTLAVFRRGQEAARTAGARPAPAIEAFINDTLQAV